MNPIDSLGALIGSVLGVVIVLGYFFCVFYFGQILHIDFMTQLQIAFCWPIMVIIILLALAFVKAVIDSQR